MGFNEENCFKLDHVRSHLNFLTRNMMSLDMICDKNDAYDFASFASPSTVIRLEKNIIRLHKVDRGFTVITFKRANQEGVASLYFGSVEDAKSFNREVYTLLKSKLVVITNLNFTLISVKYLRIV